MKDYRNLIVLCNGCGKPMREMGEWPVQYPRDTEPKNIQQSFRYMCATCRHPHPEARSGIPAGISILVEGDLSGDIYKEAV